MRSNLKRCTPSTILFANAVTLTDDVNPFSQLSQGVPDFLHRVGSKTSPKYCSCRTPVGKNPDIHGLLKESFYLKYISPKIVNACLASLDNVDVLL